MNGRRIQIAVLISFLGETCCALARAMSDELPRFKSPTGGVEVVFQPVTEQTVPLFHARASVPSGQALQYYLYFYIAGSSQPISADWYTDRNPPLSPATIFSRMLWSPMESYVVVTHGQQAPWPGVFRWVIALESASAYGFEGDHLHWIDNHRLVADLNSPKVPGGIQLVDVQKPRAELIISPHTGIGYTVAAVSGRLVTVREFFNHWGDERDKTTWEFFEPACFDLDIDTLKKRSVPCPVVSKD